MLPDLQELMVLPHGQGRLSAAQTQPPAALQAGSSELSQAGEPHGGLTWSLRSRIAKMSLTPQLPGVAVVLS